MLNDKLRQKRARLATRLAMLAIAVSALWPGATAFGQTDDSLAALKQRAGELIKVLKYTEALPILEKVVAAEPDNADMQFNLGFALIGQATNTKDAAERKATRIRARNAFLKAKELGEKAAVIDAMIDGLPVDGSDAKLFTQNAQANDLMNGSEALFSQGKLDDALLGYQRALELDPKVYEAALFCGDVYMQKGEMASAEIWYQRAIDIDPNRETAYRYSATPLMKQKKFNEARDRYVEAYIAEPYSKFPTAGLAQWAQITKTKIGHPEIEIPVQVTSEENGEMKINMTANLMTSGNDGTTAWIVYGGTRIGWHKEKFAKTFPSEKTYRHSLPEESEALRMVISLATSNKKPKNLSPALAKLKKLDDEGELEAYILLARADQGIAQDYDAYREKNRDKLRRYVFDYVLTGGGK